MVDFDAAEASLWCERKRPGRIPTGKIDGVARPQDPEASKATSCASGATSRERGDGDKGWGERQKILEERKDDKYE